ncbi:hypothetical protein [Prosthecobacter sp.]|uniref:hypothetical protein n=1 Tax=Prosthecobacter sp. TaxID=1965333 RepID=UPI003783A241
MKALFITLLIFVSAFLIYDRFLTPAGRRIVFENPPLVLPEETPSRSTTIRTERVPRPSTDSPAPLVKSGDGFVPPQIEPLEQLTKNWTVFPPTAFPRQVKLSKPVQLRMAGGASTLPAGSTAFALSAQSNVLLVAPTETSQARGQIFVHDTDMPTQVRASYERWKKGRIEQAHAAWKQKLASGAITAASMPHAVDALGKPKANADGSYDLLLASMRSGQVTDIKPAKIKRWGSPQATTIDDKPTWTLNLWYETIAFCGPLDAEAQAQIRDGQVIRWIYPGSGEPVP